LNIDVSEYADPAARAAAISIRTSRRRCSATRPRWGLGACGGQVVKNDVNDE
jgi:hypothetical protein